MRHDTNSDRTEAHPPEQPIIRGVHGEVYPCKPDIFEASYESVEAGR